MELSFENLRAYYGPRAVAMDIAARALASACGESLEAIRGYLCEIKSVGFGLTRLRFDAPVLENLSAVSVELCKALERADRYERLLPAIKQNYYIYKKPLNDGRHTSKPRTLNRRPGRNFNRRH